MPSLKKNYFLNSESISKKNIPANSELLAVVHGFIKRKTGKVVPYKEYHYKLENK